MTYIFFTYDCHGLALAYRLQEDGHDVLVGQVTDKKDIVSQIENESAAEDFESKALRLSLYDGLLDKQPADKLLEKIKSFKNTKEYFVFFDFNNLFKYSEEAAKLGFAGHFPTLEDHLLEIDRNKAKNFVRRNYPYLDSPKKKNFQKIYEAVDFLKNTSDIWVLKGKDEKARTVIPDVDNPELAREQLIETLRNESDVYERVGFILEQMVSPLIELTPEKIYYDGVPLALTVDIENKPLGSGNISIQTGCAADLVFPIDMESRINKIAFPPIIDEIAKKHRGLFFWDASILINKRTGKMFFGEFCSNRPGYNAIYSEVSQTASVDYFFSSLVKKKNPFTMGTIASSIRIFNLPKNSHQKVSAGLQINFNPAATRDIWLMDVKKNNGHLETVGYDWNLAVITGANKSLETAVSKMYRIADDHFSFEAAYYRPKFDYLTLDYNTSILNRLNYALDRHLFQLPFMVRVGEIKRSA